MSVNEKGVDIIIPVFSCLYDDIVRCIASAWRNTDLKNNKIFLLHNIETDDRCKEYINNIAGENIRAIVMESGADLYDYINVGMKCSEINDAVLINSSAILTHKWLEKLIQCAYQEECIGLVSPLCDGIIQSELYCLTIDELAEIIENYSLKLFPEISEIYSNCLFIKRSLIQEIGYIDKQTGIYGYLLRSKLMGYKYILCDNLFVYSKKRTDFTINFNVLEERYHISRMKELLGQDHKAYVEIKKNIEFFAKNYNCKRNILYYSGVNSKDLDRDKMWQVLSEQYNLFIMLKKEDGFHLTGYIDDREIYFIYSNIQGNTKYLYRDKREEVLLERILKVYKIDLVHVYDIRNITLDIYYVADRLNIPLVTSIHDFYEFCPMRIMLEIYKEKCADTNATNCDSCLQQAIGVFEGKRYADKCKEETLNALKLSTSIIFFSKLIKMKFDEIYDIRVPKQIGFQNKIKYVYQLNLKNNKNMFGRGRNSYDWRDRLYTPTQIKKFEDTYFIVDCWHHRILYSKCLNKISDWKVLVDYKGGHSITSDGRIYLCDDTDNSALRVFIKEQERFKQTQIIHKICFRPHYTLYDKDTDLFYVIGSNNGEIFTLQNQDGFLIVENHHTFEGKINAYTRSFSIIDGYMYILGDKIYKIDYLHNFDILETYIVPFEFQGMNYIEKIEDYYYISIYTDGEIHKNPMFIKVSELELLKEWEFENLYDYIGFGGSPYDISYFDNRYFITEIDQKSGIKSFIMKDNIIEDIRTEYYFDTILSDSVDRFQSKYV